MQADSTQAIEALTQSVRELSQSMAGSDQVMLYLTGGLLLCNLVLAVAAMLSAKRAREAAEASKDMVTVERERLREADRPEVTVTKRDPQLWGSDEERIQVDLCSRGPGVVENLKYTYVCEIDGQLRVFAPHESQPGPRVLDRARGERPTVNGRVSFVVPRAEKTREVVVCHYTDVYHGPDEERVYHSIFDSAVVACQRRTYRPEQTLPDEYRRFCRACEGGER